TPAPSVGGKARAVVSAGRARPGQIATPPCSALATIGASAAPLDFSVPSARRANTTPFTWGWQLALLSTCMYAAARARSPAPGAVATPTYRIGNAPNARPTAALAFA